MSGSSREAVSSPKLDMILALLTLLVAVLSVSASPPGGSLTFADKLDLARKSAKARFINQNKQWKARSIINDALSESNELTAALASVQSVCRGAANQGRVEFSGSCEKFQQPLQAISYNWEAFLADIEKIENDQDLSLASLEHSLEATMFETTIKSLIIHSDAARAHVADFFKKGSAAFDRMWLDSTEVQAKSHSHALELWKAQFQRLLDQATAAKAAQEAPVQPVLVQDGKCYSFIAQNYNQL